MTDEATASKDNYIDLRLDTISKDFFTKSRKIDAANQYRSVIHKEGKRKQNNMQKIKLLPSEHM